MKKQIPVILLAILCIGLAFSLYSAKQEIAELKAVPADRTEKVHRLDPEPEEEVLASTTPAPEEPSEIMDPVPEEIEPEPVQRMMSGMSKMMENPTMNKMMEASQRGAIGALYTDMIAYLGLNAEETEYFMDLLMHRQMKQVDLAMKMMGGTLSEEESKALQSEVEEATKLVQSEMETFLNNENDFAEFEFYEKTMGERMMLSQMTQTLSGTDAALSDDAYRDLLGMMHDEKKNFNFSSDLHDEKNTDMGPERFSKENIENFSNDMNTLNDRIIQLAQNMLTAEQLAAFESAIRASAEMQQAQLEMAGQMFGGKQN